MNKKSTIYKSVIITVVTLIIVAVVATLLLNKGGKENTYTNEDIVYKNTINISRSYVALRVKTDNLLINASDYKDYATWNSEMDELINNWKNLETKALLLEKQADFGNDEKVSFGFGFVNTAHAYTKDEISNVFDKAPAGKKIRTLAKYLGVDAKMAYEILQNDQEFVRVNALKSADTFRKLEISAIAIKNACKVAAFVGGTAMTGGAVAGAAVGSAGVGTALVGGTTAGKAVVILATGTDLMLEIGEDAAIIALGDKHKATKYISGIREYTDPIASVLSLTDIPDSVKKGAEMLDKVGVILTQADQIRSMLQDGKLLGLNIKPDSTIEVANIKESEVEKWLEEYKVKDDDEDNLEENFDEWLEAFEGLDDWLDEYEDEVEFKKEEVAVKNDGASEEYSDNIVDQYMKEMQGQAMNEYATLKKYVQKFEKLLAEGLIDDLEREELMVEAKRLGEQKIQNYRNVKEQEKDLLKENIKRREQIGKETKDREDFRVKNEARRAWLKAECERIYGKTQETEDCFYRGQ